MSHGHHYFYEHSRRPIGSMSQLNNAVTLVSSFAFGVVLL